MTVRRSSYSATNARRFLQIFDGLIKQIKAGKVVAGFIPTKDFENMKVTTLQNRISDALKWLIDNVDNIEQRGRLDPFVPAFFSKDYKAFRDQMKSRAEAKGVRLLMVYGNIDPTEAIRVSENGLTGDIVPIEASDWKAKVQEFIASPNKVMQVPNCRLSPPDELWLVNMLRPLGGEHYISGDTITLIKP